jgi:hypothetical protein
MSLNLSWNEFRRFSSLKKMFKNLDFFCRLSFFFFFFGRGSWEWFHCLLIFNAVLIFSLVQNFREFSVTSLECTVSRRVVSHALSEVRILPKTRSSRVIIFLTLNVKLFIFLTKTFSIWSHDFKRTNKNSPRFQKSIKKRQISNYQIEKDPANSLLWHFWPTSLVLTFLT